MNSNNKKPKPKTDNDPPEETPAPVNGILASDPDYILLQTEYQNANWKECDRLLSLLLEKYPDNSKLLEFKNDFEFQFDFYKDIAKTTKEKKKANFVRTTKRSLVVTGIVLAALVVLAGAFWLIRGYAVQRQLEYKAAQIETLGAQVESLLNSGQPEKADEIVVRMEQIDPANERVIELRKKADLLMEINDRYDVAAELIKNGEDAEALAILQGIEADYSGYRDVELLLQETQTRVEIALALQEGTTAYEKRQWAGAITSFEKVQMLDPSNNDANMKEMLLNSYLRRIIEMLESEDTSINEITLAEDYYRRAISMIPQSQVFLSERENLQKISSSLLELKYTQTAIAMISDPNQTQATVAQAVNYLSKASNLNPDNTDLRLKLDMMETYQVAFQDYIQMNWPDAIKNLGVIMESDEDYAGGLAKQLLYEAHMGQGNSYYSVGLYMDALKEYEAAEALVWNQGNAMSLFMVDLEIAKTLGHLKDFKGADSYYKYAVESVDYSNRAMKNPTFVSNLISAISLYSEGNYRDSYELFTSTLQDTSPLFTETEIEGQMGTCLAFIAAQNHSTVQAITERNSLTRQTLVVSDQTLVIPSMPK